MARNVQTALPLGDHAGPTVDTAAAGVNLPLPALPLDRLPAKRLGLIPAVQADADVDCALEELSYLQSRQETIDAAAQQSIRLVNADAEQKLRVRVGNSVVPFVDRRNALREAVSTYVTDNRDTFFAEGMKTRKFTFGTISFRKLPFKIAPREGLKAVDVLARILKKSLLLAALERCLKRIKIFGQPITRFVRVEPDLSLSGVKAAYTEKILGDKDLEAIGLEAIHDEERLAIEPTAYILQSESRIEA